MARLRLSASSATHGPRPTTPTTHVVRRASCDLRPARKPASTPVCIRGSRFHFHPDTPLCPHSFLPAQAQHVVVQHLPPTNISSTRFLVKKKPFPRASCTLNPISLALDSETQGVAPAATIRPHHLTYTAGFTATPATADCTAILLRRFLAPAARPARLYKCQPSRRAVFLKGCHPILASKHASPPQEVGQHVHDGRAQVCSGYRSFDQATPARHGTTTYASKRPETWAKSSRTRTR